MATSKRATPELVAPGYLHDVMEDCGIPLHVIEGMFGSKVARYVFELTNVSKLVVPMPVRAERKRLDRERIQGISWDAKFVKLIDRIDNLMEIDRTDNFAKLYAQESLELLEVLRGVDYQLEADLMNLAHKILEGE